MLEWIGKVWSPTSNQHERTILLLDCFTGHLTAPVLRALADCNTQVEIIPPGYTSKLQPMDVGINKPFKDVLRKKYINWMIEMKRRGNIKTTPKRTNVSHWIDSAWTSIHQNTIINAFHGSGFAVTRLLPIPEAVNDDNDQINDDYNDDDEVDDDEVDENEVVGDEDEDNE